jgi:histone-lysine N-methyltransferase SETMAR
MIIKYIPRAVKKLSQFFDIDGLVHREFVPRGQTVASHFCVQVLQRFRDAVRRKQLNKGQGQRFLHHDNTPSHTSLVVQQFLAEKNIPVITELPNSPDLAPSDFWLFPTPKIGLKRRLRQLFPLWQSLWS